MTRSMPTIALLFAGLTLVTLAGCERIEQAATEAAEHARQSTAEALDEAVRSGSLEQARQKADAALLEARQKAAGILGEVSDYLGGQPPASDAGAPDEDPSASAL